MVPLDLCGKGECGSRGYAFFWQRPRTLSAGLESCSGPPHAHEEELQYWGRQSSTGKPKVLMFIFTTRFVKNMYLISWLVNNNDYFCFIYIFCLSFRALVTSPKGCLLYSVSGSSPPLHLSRLFAYKQHRNTVLMNWPALFLWCRIHRTNGRSSVIKCKPSLEVLFIVSVCQEQIKSIVSSDSWMCSPWTVKKCEQMLWLFKTFQFCYKQFLDAPCLYIHSHQEIKLISIHWPQTRLLRSHKICFVCAYQRHDDLDFETQISVEYRRFMRKSHVALHWKDDVYLYRVLSCLQER